MQTASNSINSIFKMSVSGTVTELNCWHFKTIINETERETETETVQLLETYNKTSVPLNLS